MSLGTLLFSGRDWLVPAAVFLLAAAALLVWTYRRTPAGGGVRAACLALKLLGLLALAACLLEPLWSRQRARPGANLFAVLADNSQGMQIKDRGAAQSRGELLRAALTSDKTTWPATLDEHFQLRRYLFDSRLQAARDFSELAFDGRATSIGGALRTLADRYKGQPLAGVLLFTDGNATDLGEGPPDLAGLPPIYPVVIGTDDAIKDLALQKVAASQTAFEDAPVTIQADVVAGGYAGEKIVAQLFSVASGARPVGATNAPANVVSNQPAASPRLPEGGEKLLAEQILAAPREGQPLAFRFQVRPEQPGLSFYRVRVSARAELDQFSDPKKIAEATLANNTRVLAVDRGRGPYRILYVAGRPNWEFKFLNRALALDDQIELAALIRIAKREPKFDFRGRAGESSNPLFRGFGNQSKEDIESYDKPVLRRIIPREDFEMSETFPKTAEDLYSYQAVILDDLEAEFFTPDQMMLLQKFVSERGGGFLMLGGAESFAQGKFHRTPIGDMLPVYLDQAPENHSLSNLHFSITREGLLQPWARLRNNESDEQTRLKEMPGFAVLNPVRGLKPGATAIGSASDDHGARFPALAVQRFGNGRTAALTVGDLWRWGLHDEDKHRDMDKAWRQLIRWLVADVPHRLELTAEPKRGDADQSITLQLRARDKKFQPLDNAAVSLQVHSLAGDKTNATAAPAATTNAITLAAESALTEPGLYQAMYVPRATGGYRAKAVVTDADGKEVGRAEAGWTSDPAAEEFRSLKPNHALLELIAKKTGGEVVSLNALDSFAQTLPHRSAPIMETWTSPLWHQPAVFLFALLCFVAEWGLRRWKGLA